MKLITFLYASVECFEFLNVTLRVRSYFSSDGIEYNLCRVPMAGTDFSTRAYSYDDGVADPPLKNFQLQQEDRTFKVLTLTL